jgi:hypothetical protein
MSALSSASSTRGAPAGGARSGSGAVAPSAVPWGSQRRASSTNSPTPLGVGEEVATLPTRSPGRCADPSGIAHRERRSLPELALRGDRPAVQLHELVDEREADPAALVGAGRAALRTRWKRSNSRDISSAGMPVPVSRMRRLDGPVHLAQRDPDLARERELERVRQQVEDDLLPEVAVDERVFVECRAVDDEPQARALARGPEVAGEIGGETSQLGRLVVGVHAPRFDAREVEQRVHEAAAAAGHCGSRASS